MSWVIICVVCNLLVCEYVCVCVRFAAPFSIVTIKVGVVFGGNEAI